jgi:DNA-binding NarL/FixJ family response regulator
MPPLKTYLIEDSPLIRESLIAMLEDLADVEVVGTAQDEGAVEWLTNPANHADLVIVDVFLKTGSGLGVLRSTGDATKYASKVVLTNYATDDMKLKCRALGADEVFDKSNDIDALIAYCSRLHHSELDITRPGRL